MKKYKGLLVFGAVVLALALTSLTAFAASEYKTPAELVAGITGRTKESVIEERTDTGKTFGAMAAEAGKLEEFRAEVLEAKKARLAQQVAEGKITQERADIILERLESNQANCDGTGNGQIGRKMGAKFGSHGKGSGNGLGMGQGGKRMRLRDASCPGTGE